jgi:hypothetical protein
VHQKCAFALLSSFDVQTVSNTLQFSDMTLEEGLTNVSRVLSQDELLFLLVAILAYIGAGGRPTL